MSVIEFSSESGDWRSRLQAARTSGGVNLIMWTSPYCSGCKSAKRYMSTYMNKYSAVNWVFFTVSDEGENPPSLEEEFGRGAGLPVLELWNSGKRYDLFWGWGARAMERFDQWMAQVARWLRKSGGEPLPSMMKLATRIQNRLK